jgi:addiction module RelE/StbE family toxin
MRIFYSPEFSRKYKKLPDSAKELVKEKTEIFRRDPFDASLKTHKLHGRFRDFWSFSANYEYRIIFKFEENDIIKFYSIGDHSIYK